MGFIIQTYALIATVPFISFFLIYYLLLFTGRKNRTAKEFAIHFTTLLLISAVSAEINYIFQTKFGFLWSLLWVLLILIIISYLQQKMRGVLNYKKVMTSTSKLSFLSLSFFYLLFFLIGLFQR
ncbi:DUF3397 family protein [Tepidibacillus fermentans]|uniref:Uncharacterized protein DUF3397 n=1 Tax=Tepidibacillus fermentans TaxID=1281767 RepID=A0A4R3KLW0_9BACI|nr:DUF3397 family protein [Tepidibacillus fermentans]TCS84426.1 uncharacterized protein DUF3397 [Tepidibacillus fermentans]